MKPLELIAAKFSQDYSSNCPEYNGYYPTTQQGAEFKMPYFERDAAEAIAKEWNNDATNNPEGGFDTFAWDGDNLIWAQFDIDEPIIIPPVYATVEGREIKVYPIGHGSWNWEIGE